MDYKPNFSEFTYDELLDAEKHIDKDAYPERYAEVIELLNDPNHTSQGKNEFFEEIEVSKYSTFWPRFWAAFIDGILFAIILYVESLIFGFDYTQQDNFFQTFNAIQLGVYAVLMHGLCGGQTFGKMALGVKVLNHLDESEIGVKQALRRESVNLVLNTLSLILIVVVASSIETTGTLSTFVTLSAAVLGVVAITWVISEFVTMLFNEKRRALHDFIGRTVVIRT
ncbi:hypothetical protein GCM10009111_02750 [Colwellia asteriadis]|uniref:RDD domain-containing protein n=1 Tax=Colwellia asteriadis TaxID=517723 RepID=A0ABN1L2R4_9GAMM